MLDGVVADYTFAARLRGSNRIESTQFLLPPNPNVAYSTCLMRKVEEMIDSGKAPYPVERTLLVSGMLESCLESKLQGGRVIDTPHLDVRYLSPSTSAVLPDVTDRLGSIRSGPFDSGHVDSAACVAFCPHFRIFGRLNLTRRSAT